MASLLDTPMKWGEMIRLSRYFPHLLFKGKMVIWWNTAKKSVKSRHRPLCRSFTVITHARRKRDIRKIHSREASIRCIHLFFAYIKELNESCKTLSNDQKGENTVNNCFYERSLKVERFISKGCSTEAYTRQVSETSASESETCVHISPRERDLMINRTIGFETSMSLRVCGWDWLSPREKEVCVFIRLSV